MIHIDEGGTKVITKPGRKPLLTSDRLNKLIADRLLKLFGTHPEDPFSQTTYIGDEPDAGVRRDVYYSMTLSIMGKKLHDISCPFKRYPTQFVEGKSYFIVEHPEYVFVFNTTILTKAKLPKHCQKLITNTGQDMDSYSQLNMRQPECVLCFPTSMSKAMQISETNDSLQIFQGNVPIASLPNEGHTKGTAFDEIVFPDGITGSELRDHLSKNAPYLKWLLPKKK